LIFDASSVYVLVKNKDLKVLRDSRTLDLAFYEIGNAIIQEQRIGIIDQKTSNVLLEILQDITAIMDVTKFEELEANKVFEIAHKSRLTFYDASYLSLALNSGEVMVTDGRELATAARKVGIAVYSSVNYSSSTK
jgi:predicted nucleic acid-binding protein